MFQTTNQLCMANENDLGIAKMAMHPSECPDQSRWQTIAKRVQALWQVQCQQDKCQIVSNSVWKWEKVGEIWRYEISKEQLISACNGASDD